MNKQNIKYVFSLLIVLFVVIIFLVAIKFSQKEIDNTKTDNMKTDKVGGLIATWEYIEREINSDYFYQLDNTTTYKQIEEEIGEPNGKRGSGIVFPYYQIDNNLYAVISFSLDEDGKYDRVGMILLCTKDEVLEKIYPKEEKL